MPWLFDIFLFTEIYCVNMALRLSNYVVIPRILHGLTKNTISEISDDVFLSKNSILWPFWKTSMLFCKEISGNSENVLNKQLENGYLDDVTIGKALTAKVSDDTF